MQYLWAISKPTECKPFNITVIQVYAPTTNAEEAEVEWIYEDLQNFLEQTPKKKKRCPLLHRGLECKDRLFKANLVLCFLFLVWIKEGTLFQHGLGGEKAVSGRGWEEK